MLDNDKYYRKIKKGDLFNSFTFNSVIFLTDNYDNLQGERERWE